MNKNIKFSSGTMEQLTPDFYTLILYNADGKRVYTGTLPRLEAAQVMNDYNNIKMI